MDGIFLIDKEENYTSRDVVNKVIKKFKNKRVGHTGTLDPMATGVLVVCVGKATKLVNMLTSDEKEYIAEITLGIETDTLDITGNVIKKVNKNLSKEKIIAVLDSFIGKYMQEVPAYSAVKINGKKLYEYARENKKIELPTREVEIKSIDLVSNISYNGDNIVFSIKVLVSKGTYIRSLVRDIAYRLDTVGTMSKLRRIRSGKFKVINCKKIDDIDLSDMVSISNILSDKKNVIVDDLLKKDIMNGKIMNNIYGDEIIVFKDIDDKVLGIYVICEDDIKKIKPYIILGGI